MNMPLELRSVRHDLAYPEHILVATDLLDARRLIPYSIAVARANGASLTFVHAMSPEDGMEARSVAADVDGTSAARRTAMEDIARLVRAKGIPCSTAVNAGPVADVVEEVLRRTGAGQLIMGTHARHGVDKLLLGSVARKLLETVDVPVMIVGPRCKDADEGWAVRRILLASSSLDMSEPKTAVARAMAEHSHAHLTALQVVSPDRHAHCGSQHDQAPMRPIAEPVSGSNEMLTSTRITAGTPADEIGRVANEISADLIILGVHRYPFRLPFGKETTAYKVLASAPCPVLTLKSDSSLIRRLASITTRQMAAF